MRSGTTYLATILDEHPEISMAKPLFPEPKFFINDDEYKKGLTFYRSKYFNHSSGIRVFGEKTVHYCEKEEAAKRIKLSYPDSIIIMLLRDPAYRAISNYFFSYNSGLETRSLEEVFIKKAPPPGYNKKMFISPFDYLNRGKYIEYIKIYENYFDKKNIRILFFEELIGKKNEVRKLFEFLTVSSSYKPPSIEKKIHSSGYNKSEVNPEVIAALKEYFIPYNANLESYLGIKLERWNNYN